MLIRVKLDHNQVNYNIKNVFEKPPEFLSVIYKNTKTSIVVMTT